MVHHKKINLYLLQHYSKHNENTWDADEEGRGQCMTHVWLHLEYFWLGKAYSKGTCKWECKHIIMQIFSHYKRMNYVAMECSSHSLCTAAMSTSIPSLILSTSLLYTILFCFPPSNCFWTLALPHRYSSAFILSSLHNYPAMPLGWKMRVSNTISHNQYDSVLGFAFTECSLKANATDLHSMHITCTISAWTSS